MPTFLLIEKHAAQDCPRKFDLPRLFGSISPLWTLFSRWKSLRVIKTYYISTNTTETREVRYLSLTRKGRIQLHLPEFNDTTKAFNRSEILPFTFLNDLVNRKVVIKTSAGDYTGMLKG